MLTPDDILVLQSMAQSLIDSITFLTGVVSGHIVATIFRIY